MQANINDTPETVLDSQIDTSPEADIDLTLEAECVPIDQWPRKKKNMYLGKLRLLGTIHAEVADTINASREANYQAFFMPSDKYIPESKEKNLYVKLALGTFFAGMNE